MIHLVIKASDDSTLVKQSLKISFCKARKPSAESSPKLSSMDLELEKDEEKNFCLTSYQLLVHEMETNKTGSILLYTREVTGGKSHSKILSSNVFLTTTYGK